MRKSRVAIWGIWIGLFFFHLQLRAQIDHTPEDVRIINAYFDQMQSRSRLSVPQLLIETALYFKDTPYVAATLEKEPERLVVNLRSFDCTTFVENCLALVRTLKMGDVSFEQYVRNLQMIRYRDGVVDGYPSRLHYTTDWIYDNQRRGIVQDVTGRIGGKPLLPGVGFMSAHPDKYAPLKHHPALAAQIRSQEDSINARPYFYLPKKQIVSQASSIQNGDILAFTTNINGLDVTHMGLAYWKDGLLTFVHASSSAGKVIVHPVGLAAYTAANKHHTGIIIVRACLSDAGRR